VVDNDNGLYLDLSLTFFNRFSLSHPIPSFALFLFFSFMQFSRHHRCQRLNGESVIALGNTDGPVRSRGWWW